MITSPLVHGHIIYVRKQSLNCNLFQGSYKTEEAMGLTRPEKVSFLPLTPQTKTHVNKSLTSQLHKNGATLPQLY